MQPHPPISGIRQTSTVIDDDVTLVTIIEPNLSFAEVWAVKRDGASQQLGRSQPGALGKVDSASARAFDDGTVRLVCSAFPLMAAVVTSSFLTSPTHCPPGKKAG